MGKQEQRRNMNPKKRKPNLAKKTGAKKDNLDQGYKQHANALKENSLNTFISKIK
jgi:hypothetical protein